MKKEKGRRPHRLTQAEIDAAQEEAALNGYCTHPGIYVFDKEANAVKQMRVTCPVCDRLGLQSHRVRTCHEYKAQHEFNERMRAEIRKRIGYGYHPSVRRQILEQLLQDCKENVS